MSSRVLSGIAWMKRRLTWLLAPAAAGVLRLGSLETIGADVQPCNATELARGSPPWHNACQSSAPWRSKVGDAKRFTVLAQKSFCDLGYSKEDDLSERRSSGIGLFELGIARS